MAGVFLAWLPCPLGLWGDRLGADWIGGGGGVSLGGFILVWNGSSPCHAIGESVVGVDPYALGRVALFPGL